MTKVIQFSKTFSDINFIDKKYYSKNIILFQDVFYLFQEVYQLQMVLVEMIYYNYI